MQLGNEKISLISLGTEPIRQVVAGGQVVYDATTYYFGSVSAGTLVLSVGTPLTGSYVYVNWGDGTCSSISTSTASHTYSTAVTNLIVVVYNASAVGLDVNSAYHLNLSRVIVAEGVTTLVTDAFALCENLTSINLPQSITTLNSHSLYGTALETVTIPSQVTVISDYAFYACRQLQSVTVSDSVTTVGELAFYGCVNLADVSFSNLSNLTTISRQAFGYCSALDNFSIPATVQNIGAQAFIKCTGLQSITLPSSITTLGNGVFSQCSSLTNVNLGTSVTDVPASMFYACSSLTTVKVGSLTSIGSSAFSSCTSFEQFTRLPSTQLNITSIGNQAFANCTSFNDTAIFSRVTSFSGSAFMNCTSLVTANLASATAISGSLFKGCTSLKSVAVGSNVTSIGASAFAGCTSLSSSAYGGEPVVFSTGSTLTSIGNNAFDGCTGLDILYLPSSISEIGKQAFKGCTALVGDGRLTLGDPTDSSDYSNWKISEDEITWTNFPALKIPLLAKNTGDYFVNTYVNFYWNQS